MLTRFTICSLCSLTLCTFSYSRFRFEGGIWVLIAPVLGHCLLVTFTDVFIICYGNFSVITRYMHYPAYNCDISFFSLLAT